MSRKSAYKKVFAFYVLTLFVYPIYPQLFQEVLELNQEYYKLYGGDFDNDDDIDILIIGSRSIIYRNDGNFQFSEIDPGLPSVIDGTGAWGDFDSDGDLDIAISGKSGNSIISKVYQNDGNSVFFNINAELKGLYKGSSAWGDYDNDGRIDLLICGLNANDEPTSILYHNDGSGKFSDSGIYITPCVSGDIKWGDYNNDNFLDLLMLGKDFNANDIVEIFENDGNDNFTSINANFKAGFEGEVDWGDYDNDGDLDVLYAARICGVRVYKNKGNRTFEKISQPLPPIGWCSARWGDYDNDGDLDFIVCGLDQNNFAPKTFLFNNSGNDVFIADSSQIFDCGYSSLVWADFDKDADLDIVITGFTSEPKYVTKIYRNGVSKRNNKPSIPAGLKATVTYNNALLSWDPSIDPETVSKGLSYNIRLGTLPSNIDVVSPAASITSGVLRIASPGNASLGTDFSIKKLSPGTYYWSVQAVDPGLNSSPFSEEGTFNILPVISKMDNTFPSLSSSSVATGDYDNDGDMDLLLTGTLGNNESMPFTKIYKNISQFLFDTVSTSLINVHTASTAWGDFDNDGDLDILITGFSGAWPDRNPISKVFRNDGNDNFIDINAGLQGISYGSCAWGDYDNDGDLDILISGEEQSFIYRNDKKNTFTRINANLVTSRLGSAEWGDYDNDKDLDILIYGVEKTMIYQNKGNDVFLPLSQTLPGSSEGSASWGDYNNDGNLDILLTGQEGIYIADQSYLKTINNVKIYKNNGNGNFSDIGVLFRGVSESKGIWCDFNNDGHLDIIYVGRNLNFICKIYLNNGNGIFTDLGANINSDYRSVPTAADFDNDGDNDLFITRYHSKPEVFRNNMASQNSPPTAPNELRMALSDSGGVVLSWAPARDDSTPESAITYNLRMGTKPGSIDVISPMSNLYSGSRMQSGKGMLQDTSWIFRGVFDTVYYWSVQAIDNSFFASPFASEQILYINNTEIFVDFNFKIVCFGDSSGFYDNSISIGPSISEWKWNFGDGNYSTLRNPFHKYANPGIFSVKLTITVDNNEYFITKDVPVENKPVTNFLTDIACQGALTTFLNTSQNNETEINSWQWSFGDGSSSVLKDPLSHGYLNPGNYSVKLTALASNGCVDSVRKIVTVANYPVAVVTANAPLSFCSSDSVTLSAGYNSNFTYNWLLNGIPVTGGDSSRLTVHLTGKYSVEVTNKTGNCKTTSDQVTVNAIEAPVSPVIVTSGSAEFCQGDSVVLSVTEVPGYTYQWKLNGGAVGSNTYQLSAKSQGTYSVEVKNNTGCKVASVNSITTIVNSLPSVSSVSLSGSTDFCEGGSLTMSVPPVAGYSYQWSNSAGPIAGAIFSSYTATSQSQYILTITNQKGCSKTSHPVNVIVKTVPSSPLIVAEDYKPGQCNIEKPVTLKVDQTVADYSYQWKRNGTAISQSTGTYLQGFLAQGDYTVEVNNNGCKNESLPQTIYFDDAPEKPLLYSRGPSVWYLACSNDSASYYKWYCNEKLIEGADKYYYVANRRMGDYQVSIGNSKGCFTMSDIVTIPSGITGIEDIDPFEGLIIYPNPTKGLFTIEMDNEVFGDLLIGIITEQGKDILSVKFEKATEHFSGQIDLSGQPKGMYIINLLIENYSTTRKVIVE